MPKNIDNVPKMPSLTETALLDGSTMPEAIKLNVQRIYAFGPFSPISGNPHDRMQVSYLCRQVKHTSTDETSVTGDNFTVPKASPYPFLEHDSMNISCCK